MSLSNVEQVEIYPWASSCGLRTVEIGYQGERYFFDLSHTDDNDPPDTWLILSLFGNTVVRVGSFEDEVWAVGPDGSYWRLVQAGEASLFCL